MEIIIGIICFVCGSMLGFLLSQNEKQKLKEKIYKLENDLYDCKNDLKNLNSLEKKVENSKSAIKGNGISIYLPNLNTPVVKKRKCNVSDIDNFDLRNKNIVITGAIKKYERPEVENIVLSMGANIQRNVTKKTNVLIQGEQDLNLVGESGLSNKQLKAYEYIDLGIQIDIIEESEFVKLIEKQKQ